MPTEQAYASNELTCGAAGVHDARCILGFGWGWLSWLVNPHFLKVCKGVHLDTLQPKQPTSVQLSISTQVI